MHKDPQGKPLGVKKRKQEKTLTGGTGGPGTKCHVASLFFYSSAAYLASVCFFFHQPVFAYVLSYSPPSMTSKHTRHNNMCVFFLSVIAASHLDFEPKSLCAYLIMTLIFPFTEPATTAARATPTTKTITAGCDFIGICYECAYQCM